MDMASFNISSLGNGATNGVPDQRELGNLTLVYPAQVCQWNSEPQIRLGDKKFVSALVSSELIQVLRSFMME